MLRSSASISRCSASAPVSGARLTRARRYGRDVVTSSSCSRASPCTIRRRLPSGSLNILWMWLAVPTRIQIVLLRLLDSRVALREDADQLAAGDRLVDQADRALARHGERHERVRKQHGVAERKNRKLVRDVERPIG